MRSIGQATLRSLRAKLVLFVAVVPWLACATALGHEWTLNSKKVKAKAIDFNGTAVTLEDEQGKRKAFPINELVAEDLQYLTNLLSIRNANIQQQLQRQQIRQQQTQLLSQFVDIWTVRMVAPNGESGWRNYFASNSLHAKQQAWHEFPDFRVVGVQRIRRTGVLGGGGANLGMAPVISQSPLGPAIGPAFHVPINLGN